MNYLRIRQRPLGKKKASGLLHFLIMVCIPVVGLLLTLPAFSQGNSTLAGIQFKPVFSSNFFRTGPQTINDSSFTYKISQSFSYSAGLIIRRGYTKSLAVEFGINYVSRGYSISPEFSGKKSITTFKIIGYEIPVTQLIFIQLAPKVFMNAAAGFCINMFPSDVAKRGEDVLAYAGRDLIFNPSLIANIGAEYRSAKNGTFYLGASFNRPFSPIYDLAIDYVRNQNALNSVYTKLRGTYLTIDFRYFLHENPDKKRRK